MRIVVVFASADGSTEGIARRIGQRLRERGLEAWEQPLSSPVWLDSVDAVVIGSAVHSRQWLEEATLFVDTHRSALHDLPFWTFSVGMPDALPKVFRDMAGTEENAIIDRLGDLRPRGHRLFSGVVKPSQFPLVSRMFLRLVGGRYGDFRNWAAIDAWASEIADELAVKASEGEVTLAPEGRDGRPPSSRVAGAENGPMDEPAPAHG